MEPIPLTTQEQYEALWFGQGTKPFLIWFTAAWCKPCKRLDPAAIAAVAAVGGIPFYICDYTVNNYTPGYCGVRAFPTFLMLQPQRELARLTSSSTETVCEWIRNL
jgi:thiol-disulfide isomerase/thioredoxin